MDKLYRFNDCLKLYLSKDLNIEDKEKRTFNWLKEKANTLKEGSDKYKKLIKTIEDHIMELASTSISQFFELSRIVFYQSYGRLVERRKIKRR